MTAPKIALRIVSSNMDSEVLLASAGTPHVARDKGDRESKRLRRALWNGMLKRFKKGQSYALEKEMYLGVLWRI